MTEHAVVNVHGEDRQKIKGGVGDCNGGTQAVVNGVDVGGKIHVDVTRDSIGGSDAVSAAADGGSAASDLVAVIDDNGDGGSGAEGLKVSDGESQVTVSEIKNKESVGTDSSAVSKVIAKEEIREKEISNGTVSVDGGNSNLGSVTLLDVSGDLDVADVVVVDEGVIDVNKNHNKDHKIKNSVASTDVQHGVVDRGLNEQTVENEIHGGDAKGSTTITDSNGAVDAQNGVEDEIHGNGVITVTVANGPVDVQNGVEDEIHDDGVTTVTVANGPIDVQNGVKDEIHGDADRDANGELGIHSSSVENKTHGDSNKDTITDVNVEVSVQNSVENEFRDDVTGVEIAGVDVLGDEKDTVTVFEGVADENKSHVEVESVAVVNGLAVENDVPVVHGVSATYAEERANNSDRTSSGEKTQTEPVYSGGGDEKDGGTVVQPVQERSKPVSDTNVGKSLEYTNIVSTDVSDEKDIITNKIQDGELESVPDIRNGEETSLSEFAEKNVVSVDVDGVSPTTDVKGRADDFHQDGLEKAQIKSVIEVDVEGSVVGAEVQNGLADPESDCTKEKEVPVERQVGSKPENFEETIHEPVIGEQLSAINSTDITIDSNVISDMSGNELESKAEPSADISDLKNIAAESKAEPSKNVVKSETEPSLQGDISVEGGNNAEADSRPKQEGSSTADSFDVHNVGSEVVKRPFYYLIRLPRYDDDENIQEQINNALKQVDEKTEHRGKIRAEINNRKDLCNEYRQDYNAAKSAERTTRVSFNSKRQELDSVKSTMNRLNNTISVGDIDNKIRNMEHMIQHETLPLNEEKQLIRQIKQLKQNRGELSSIIGKQDQSQQSTEQNDSIEEQTKRSVHLKKELDLLRNNLQKAEAATKAAQKKYDDEWDKLSELQGRFNVADRIRQEAYTHLRALKSQLHEKKKYFWEYKGAITKGQELAAEGKKEELQSFCIDEVERIMELWNKSDEFRRDYIRCNTRSTLRRLQTLDGRALGPGEQPPVIPNATITERVSKNNSQITQLTLEQETKSTSIESVNIKDEPVSKVVLQKTERSQTTKVTKPAKPAPLEKSSVAVLHWGDEPDEPEDSIEEPVRTKEEEELIVKAEKARKEAEAAKLKEKRRLEEIEKAKEAMERKKRNAEKAQQRAILKAQKDAEQKEKEREKKARKKERRKAATIDNAENTEQEPAPTSESHTITEEIDQSEKPVEVTKRPQKQPQFPKQTSKSKSVPVPLPLRNRGKRRIQPWMWWALIVVLVVVALFYMVGNISSLRY